MAPLSRVGHSECRAAAVVLAGTLIVMHAAEQHAVCGVQGKAGGVLIGGVACACRD